MANVDEKEGIMLLPIKERTVAVALKHIFDKIKKLEDEENEEVQKLHAAFSDRYRQIEQNTSQVVKGTPIPTEYLQDTDKFFTESERKDVAALSANNKGIEAYWLTTLLNYYEQDLTLADKEIAAAIVDVSIHTTLDMIGVTFQISVNEWLQSGTVSKSFVIENGVVTKCQGDSAKWLKAKPEGVLASLLSEATQREEMGVAFDIAGDFINSIVPYSLEYFLGAAPDEGDGEEIEEDGEDEDDEDEEDEEPTKKVKE